ncbi:SGNH/GDSL hydrolase family protein [Methylobacterium sp. sgz302541]|uniref:SGNH/GDSL hydrolase family protein n=1 Tax=unclassified Methylobacterium TaxID=2615210 RepID=UPI003D34E71B
MISPSHLLGSFRVKSLRGLARGALVAATLLALPTAVLAYADLLPDSFDLSALGLGTPTADLPHVARQIAAGEPLRIVAFGSSSTEGIGASSPAAAYPARLEVALKGALPHLAGGVTVLNRGIGGEHTDDMLLRLDRDVLQAKPQLVIWQTGSNDALRGVTLEHFREATIATVRQMQDAEIDVVLMEPQWCPKFDATPGAYRFRDAVREIGDELGVPVIRRSELMRDWVANAKLTKKQLFAADGLHMADGGYALLARAAADEILRDAGSLKLAEAQATAID